MISNTEILQHALVGYQAQREQIELRIADLRRRLNGSAVQEAPQPKRRLSPDGRARIAAAAKRRWANARRQKRVARD